MLAVLLPFLLLASTVAKDFGCSPKDHPSDCLALTALASATNYESWTKNTKWGKSDESVCLWHGVTCNKDGRVANLSLKENNLKGYIPKEIGNLTMVSYFHLNGDRPANYQGCSSTDFKNTSLPQDFFLLTELTDVDLEYSCLGGTLEGFGTLTKLVSLQLHGNYITGTIPMELNNLKDVEILKLGRNPITGELPKLALPKAIQFNCNFCSLTGTFPDFFEDMPSLQISYWDGNGFTGPLPPSIGKAKNLKRLSFNINQFSGAIPDGICDIPAGDGGDTPDVSHDCRIGADTNLTVYQADYPWIQKVKGNMYDCSKGVPKCAVSGSCNKTKGTAVVNPVSPVRCMPGTEIV
eukprot:m.22765 g.22765  ORF g.22765 m.22765 type:complete len:351 (-) comp7435_c0_seq1:53-1105(-)